MVIIPLIFWGIPPAPRGVPQIEVTFDIDANGTGSSFGRAVVKRKKMEIYKDFIWDDCGIWWSKIENTIK